MSLDTAEVLTMSAQGTLPMARVLEGELGAKRVKRRGETETNGFDHRNRIDPFLVDPVGRNPVREFGELRLGKPRLAAAAKNRVPTSVLEEQTFRNRDQTGGSLLRNNSGFRCCDQGCAYIDHRVGQGPVA